MRVTYSRWITGDGRRGTLDLNFAYQDGSVKLLETLPLDDNERTVRVPQYRGMTEDSSWYSRLPIEE